MTPNQTTIEIGTIMVTDFGATMQLPTFYKVTKRTAKTIFMVRLKQIVVEGDGMLGKSMPIDEEDKGSYCYEMQARIKDEPAYQHRNEVAWSAKNQLYFAIWNGHPQHHNHFD